MGGNHHEPGIGVPPKLDKTSPTGRLNVTASEALLAQVEEWRSAQRPIPNKAEAARMLIEIGLRVEREKASRN